MRSVCVYPLYARGPRLMNSSCSCWPANSWDIRSLWGRGPFLFRWPLWLLSRSWSTNRYMHQSLVITNKLPSPITNNGLCQAGGTQIQFVRPLLLMIAIWQTVAYIVTRGASAQVNSQQSLRVIIFFLFLFERWIDGFVATIDYAPWRFYRKIEI